MRIVLVLVLAVAAALAQPAAEIAVTSQTVNNNFTGVGFHAEMFLNTATPEFFDQVIAKRWKELNPAFARVFHRWAARQPGVRDQAALDTFLKQFLFLKEATGTEVYLTTGSPKDTEPGAEREQYAKAVVDELEYLLKGGATNVTTYCMSNELSMGRWAGMVKDLPKFQDYHRLLHAEIQRRGLPILLLSTDASPVNYWHTIEWAAANMDDITGVYGGHHYANEHPPDDLSFYAWFREKNAWGVGIARSKGKEFILGEFGPAQFLQHKYGVRWDTCRYFGTKEEALAGLQLAEAALAAMNGGVRAMGYWTFMDYPDNADTNSINQWGLFKWLKNDAAVRAPYYSYGLLSKFFRGPAKVFVVNTADPLIRAAAMQNNQTGRWSLALINRHQMDRAVNITLPASAAGAVFRRYEYVASAVPETEDGDLQEPIGKAPVEDGRISTLLKGSSLTVFTTNYDEEAPPAVEGLRATRQQFTRIPQHLANVQVIQWNPSTAKDVIYYRVYYGGKRIGSSATTEFSDMDVRRPAGLKYGVAAVDSSGNASRMVECAPGS